MFEPIKIEKETPPKQKDPEAYRIRYTDAIPEPDVVLYMSGAMVATRQNLFAVTGKAKAGKTFLLTLIISAVLEKGQSEALSSFCKAGFDEIVLFDTEQSSFHVKKVLQRVFRLVGEQKMERLKCYSIRSIKKSERRDFIKQIIYNDKKNALILIDGIADLIRGVNDEQAADDLLEEVQSWAEETNSAIGFVLHQNPSESSKMRGHAGTFATNKCETTIQVSNTKEKRIKLVDTTFARNIEPEPFSFEIDKDGIPRIENECYQEPKAGRKPQKQLTDIEKYSLLNEIFIGDVRVSGIGYNVLTEKLKETHQIMHGVIGLTAVKQLISYCKEMRWIAQDLPNKSYFQHPFN